MKQEILQQFDGYEDTVKEIEAARKLGPDYAQYKGRVEHWINRYHPPRLALRVSDIIEETATAKTFRLVSTDRVLPPFQAGQYLALSFQFGLIKTGRPYSISSSPKNTAYYDVTVRRVPNGLVSNYLLDDIHVGHDFESSGPAGGFVYNPVFHGRSLVFIAGGSGIAPFMSMIRESLEGGLDRDIILFYGNHSSDDVIFHSELVHLASRFKNLRYVPVIEEQGELAPVWPYHKGLITADVIRQTAGDLTGRMFYMCGPSAMYDFCNRELESMGVSRRRIRQESYGPPTHISRCPGWPETLTENTEFRISVNGTKTIPAWAGQSVLTALERGGFYVQSQCHSGECGAHRISIGRYGGGFVGS